MRSAPTLRCGTTIAAAQQLGRRWIGIDITHLSISLMKKNRLKDSYHLESKRDYDVKGEPEDLASARQLATDDRYQIQWWALSLVEARPVGGEGGSKESKKGADREMDGVILFMNDHTGKAKRAAVQVKSGHVMAGYIRDLRGVLDGDEAALALFITLENPTKEMQAEAAAAGVYHSPGWNRDYPRLQILTVADPLNGAEPKMPPATVTFKQAAKLGAWGRWPRQLVRRVGRRARRCWRSSWSFVTSATGGSPVAEATGARSMAVISSGAPATTAVCTVASAVGEGVDFATLSSTRGMQSKVCQQVTRLAATGQFTCSTVGRTYFA